jgi:methyl-accepting chemotaxis protein
MKIRDLRITVKLVISAAGFLLPLGIMLYIIISISFASIKKDQKELNGIEVLRPAISLMQIIPQYTRYTLDNAQGDLEYTKRHASLLFIELRDIYAKHFGLDVSYGTIQAIKENWENLLNENDPDTYLIIYRQIILDLHKLIVYVGDVSGLITDSDIGNAYLIAASIHELPQAQERMILITNILRTSMESAISRNIRSELTLNLELLIYSDNARIKNRFDAVDALRIRSADTLDSFEYLLKNSYDRIEYFSNSVEYVLDNPVFTTESFHILYENAVNANNAAYRLQDAALDRLKYLIGGRIKTYENRFIGSLITALVASALAFTLVIYIILNIRESTRAIRAVFKRLDDNDLTVQLQALSKDEFGKFMTALSDFLNKLNTAFISFNESAGLVTTAVLDISSSSRQIAATANEQSASVSEIVNTMENNNALSAQSTEKTVEVARLAAETRQLSQKGANLRDVNEDVMLDIRNQNVKIIDIIKNLDDKLSKIDESIHIIDTIADRTKLIAFNAALEAASAGEEGARFSAVAGEIRRFAYNVAESVLEIKEQIAEILEASQILITEANNGSKAIEGGYKRMVEQKEVFENIVDVSEKVAVHSRQISDLSKQQEIASAQVFTALKEISAGVSQFVSATTATSATVEKLNVMAAELKETLDKYHTTNRGEA